MPPIAQITTSWDDGHPLDLRVAALLAANGLRGTFYVPRSAETATMSPAQVRALADGFEIGGHTLRHLTLTGLVAAEARREIEACKGWVEDVTGRPCPMFCPPRGRFNAGHLRMVREAGFLGLRTVELLSMDPPRRRGGLLLMPTTVQARPHPLSGYARNFARRAAVGNLWQFVVQGGSTDWVRLADALARRIVDRGGVFHLWGHSWELQEADQWRRLETVLQLLGPLGRSAEALTNGEVCASAARRAVVDARPIALTTGNDQP